MARGTAAGEPVVSQASTKEYEEACDRIFGKDRQVQRGRWIWDEEAQKLVRAEDYRPPEHAKDAPVMVDRFYENVRTLDGADIGSRKKHRAYMKAKGLAPSSDFSESWYAKIRKDRADENRKQIRESLRRTLYKMDPP